MVAWLFVEEGGDRDDIWRAEVPGVTLLGAGKADKLLAKE
jgi:hypothetical protein